MFITSKIKAPCQNCPNRKVGCRADCEAWKAYEEQKTLEEQQKKRMFLGYLRG